MNITDKYQIKYPGTEDVGNTYLYFTNDCQVGKDCQPQKVRIEEIINRGVGSLVVRFCPQRYPIYLRDISANGFFIDISHKSDFDGFIDLLDNYNTNPRRDIVI